MAHLITGYKGEEHIQSADHGSFNAALVGDEQYVMESGNGLEGSIIDNNTVRILDGDVLMYGRHIRINPDTYEDMTIDTGTAGKNRIDLICMTYTKNTSDGTENASLQVIKGTETEGAAVAPSYTDGNILEGASFNQMPLYKVSINGVVLADITPVFETITSISELKKSVANGKTLVANAISGKGVETATDASFATMAANINSIAQGSGNATDADVLSGKTYSNDSGSSTGTMADKTGTTVTASTVTKDDTYTYFGIPETGKYDTDSKVRTLNSNLAANKVYYLGIYNGEIDATTIPNYSNLTVDNFIISPNSYTGYITAYSQSDGKLSGFHNFEIQRSYNSTTGKFTLSNVSCNAWVTRYGGYLCAECCITLTNIKVYVIVGDIESI